MKFHIWEGEKLRGHLYSSDNHEPSISDEKKLCELLKIPFESTWLAPTHEDIDSFQLPEKPTFTNAEGRKYWLSVY
jgi:hypothetical protein